MKLFLANHIEAKSNAAIAHTTSGHTFRARFLSDTLLRVTVTPAAGFKEPRTWAIAPLQKGAKRSYAADYTADVAWEGRARASEDGFSPPTVKIDSTDATLSLQTNALRCVVHADPLRIELFDIKTNACVHSDRETTAYLSEARTGNIRHYVQRTRDERYYGLGDKTGPLNLHGRRLRTLAMDSLGYDPEHGDPLYKHWPFLLTRSASGAWVGTYYDTLAACTFDLGAEHDNYHGLYRYVEIEDGDLDYYMMVGPTPADVLKQWMQLIGGTHLPPRWTLGFAQTAMGLADAPDAQARLTTFIDEVLAQKVPISAFHYGSGYSSKGKRRYVFTWNTSKFPDPDALNAKFHASGMRTVANVKPCLLDDHPAFDEVGKHGGFVHDTHTKSQVMEPFWDGQGAHLDFTNAQTIAWWQRGVATQLLARGMDAAWNDNNEYAVLDENAQCDGFAAPMANHRTRPLHALLMTRATFEEQAKHTAENFTVTRAGPPGIQRYAQTWSGDNFTDWRNLKWNIRTGLQMSLSGMFNIGHDVGGFHGPIPDPELFVRWVQACALNPRMVMNSWKENNFSSVPWMHAEVTPLVLAALRLRYRLLPYLWQCFERASEEHVPIIRPTFFVFPDDERGYADCDDFMLGDALLVAPVVEAHARAREVYLPALPNGGQWFDFYTREAYASGATHHVPAPLEKLPIFVCEGAKIPTAQVPPNVRPRHDDPTSEILLF
jgi:alpha-glucosidase